MRKLLSTFAGCALFAAAAGSQAATINFNNGSGVYSAGGVTATVSVTTVRSGDGLYYNSTENAIGVGSSKTTGAMGYKEYNLFKCGFVGCFTEGETITVTFDQEVTVDNVYLRQWEDNVAGFGDEVNFTSAGGNVNFDKSDGYDGSILVDRFETGVTTTSFTLTPVQGGTNGAGATVKTAVYLHSLDFSVSEVPLPAAAWLFGSAMLGLIGVGRRRKLATA